MQEPSFRRFFRPNKSRNRQMLNSDGSEYIPKHQKPEGKLIWNSRVFRKGSWVGVTRVKVEQ